MTASLTAARVVVSVVDKRLGVSMQIGPLPNAERASSFVQMMVIATTKQEALDLVRIIKDLAEDLPDASRTGTPRVIT